MRKCNVGSDFDPSMILTSNNDQLVTVIKRCGDWLFFSFLSKNVQNIYNKHTESIAKAIQVPHRPQQIQISNSWKKLVYRGESELDL